MAHKDAPQSVRLLQTGD